MTETETPKEIKMSQTRQTIDFATRLASFIELVQENSDKHFAEHSQRQRLTPPM